MDAGGGAGGGAVADGEREPVRSCVGCRRRAPKRELRRVVRTPAGEVRWDPSGTAPGRGAYLCRDVRCFEMAVRRGRLARALRLPGEEAGAWIVRLRDDA